MALAFRLVRSDTLGLVQVWDEDGNGPLGTIPNWVALIVFTLDVIAHFNISFEDVDGHTIMNRWGSGKNYLKTWFLQLLLSFSVSV